MDALVQAQVYYHDGWMPSKHLDIPRAVKTDFMSLTLYDYLVNFPVICLKGYHNSRKYNQVNLLLLIWKVSISEV